MKTPEMRGRFVVVLLLVLTGVVGTLFIALGPQATERSPGVVHVGVRYANEMSMEFNQHGKTGPGARIELIDRRGEIAYAFGDLKIGRNLVPLQDVPAGPYTARLSAPGYETREVSVIVEGRMLNPPKDAVLEAGTIADFNLIGVRFKPVGKNN
ncbi:MAG: hypothetical protein GVY36_07780 [Verrucomicrobia bacterium]|nr:hypothetical protein [Verrucomicrobiota bacterium]